MVNDLPYINLDEGLSWEPIPPDTIELSPAQVSWAVELSQAAPNDLGQWQLYLNALALTGFREWLEEWGHDLSCDDRHCSLYQPQWAGLLNAVCQVQIHGFSLCLVPIASDREPTIALPQMTVDLPEFVPHIYVLVEVEEEQRWARVCGYLRQDQLTAHRQHQSLVPTPDWTYTLPRDWFEFDPNALLLDLRCLDRSVVPRPVVPAPALVTVTELRDRFPTLQTQLRSSLYPPDQLLTWNEVATLLTHPDLATELYELQRSPQPPTTAPTEGYELPQLPIATPGEGWQRLVQPIINLANWLQNRLDQAAETLDWVLLPPLETVPALRSVMSEVQNIVELLRRQGIPIPPQARLAYRDLPWERQTLRLYVAIWALDSSSGTMEDQPDWSLLLVLVTTTGLPIPIGVRLQVRDERQLLDEKQVNDQSNCLYIQTEWAHQEQCQVIIHLPNQSVTQFMFTFD